MMVTGSGEKEGEGRGNRERKMAMGNGERDGYYWGKWGERWLWGKGRGREMVAGAGEMKGLCSWELGIRMGITAGSGEREG